MRPANWETLALLFIQFANKMTLTRFRMIVKNTGIEWIPPVLFYSDKVLQMQERLSQPIILSFDKLQ